MKKIENRKNQKNFKKIQKKKFDEKKKWKMKIPAKEVINPTVEGILPYIC